MSGEMMGILAVGGIGGVAGAVIGLLYARWWITHALIPVMGWGR